MAAIITLQDYPLGTDYAAYAMHKSKVDRDMHQEMGQRQGTAPAVPCIDDAAARFSRS
jgi:hypothetical protein